MNQSAADPAWVTRASQMPLAFAQVREDPLIDLAVLSDLAPSDLRGIMIGSGGCTAALLAASGRFSHLHLVDMNAAQMALCRLKIHLLQTTSPAERLQLMGHLPMEGSRERAISLQLKFLELDRDVLGPLEIVANLGPDHAGRYELLFAQLRSEMPELTERWPAIFALTDAAERSALIAPDTHLGREMDSAFDRTMALPHLIRLFSAEATQNMLEPFARHFAARTWHAIATLPTGNNPYLWQLLTGRFPTGTAYPWFTAKAPAQLPKITTTIGRFDDALSNLQQPCDFVHLSNILDWLSPTQARRMLDLSRQALRRGGVTIIRQLNSSLDLPSLCPELEWLTSEADRLHAEDRSFFYRQLHIGKKR